MWFCARSLGLLGLLTALAGPAAAHEFRPAFLEAREVATGLWQLSWRLPLPGAELHPVQPLATPPCQLQRLSSRRTETLQVSDYRLDCRAQPSAAALRLNGLEQAPHDALAEVHPLGAAPQQRHLYGQHDRLDLAQTGAGAGARGLLAQGWWHVMAGPDHLTYMLLLYLFLRGRRRQLLLGVTGFTLAHSASLALAALGLLRLPTRPVEALIALSICYFAVQLLRGRRAGDEDIWRWQAVILGCGLLHGLGFASSLAALGIERSGLLWGIASFNLGIEAAQLCVIGAAALLLALLRRWLQEPQAARVEQAGSLLIGATGAFWYLQRLLI